MVLLLILQLLQYQVSSSVSGDHSPGVSVRHHLQLPEQGESVLLSPSGRGVSQGQDAGVAGAGGEV